MIRMPSSIDRVARSHSGSTSTAGAQRRDRFPKLGATHRPPAGGLLLVNALAAFGDQRAKLPSQVLMLRGDARIADFSHENPRDFRDGLSDH